MKIDLIAISYPNWDAFLSHIKEATGSYPTSGLAQTYLKENSPAAFLASLDLRNQQLNQLRKGYQLNDAFYHFMVTFALTLDADLSFRLLSICSYMHYIVHPTDMGEFVLIMSGNMMEWHRCIIHGLKEDQPQRIRQIIHIIYTHLTGIGMKEIWADNKKTTAKDGTLIFL